MRKNQYGPINKLGDTGLLRCNVCRLSLYSLREELIENKPFNKVVDIFKFKNSIIFNSSNF